MCNSGLRLENEDRICEKTSVNEVSLSSIVIIIIICICLQEFFYMLFCYNINNLLSFLLDGLCFDFDSHPQPKCFIYIQGVSKPISQTFPGYSPLQNKQKSSYQHGSKNEQVPRYRLTFMCWYPFEYHIRCSKC